MLLATYFLFMTRFLPAPEPGTTATASFEIFGAAMCGDPTVDRGVELLRTGLVRLPVHYHTGTANVLHPVHLPAFGSPLPGLSLHRPGFDLMQAPIRQVLHTHCPLSYVGARQIALHLDRSNLELQGD